MQLFAFLTAILNVKLEECAVNQPLHVMVIVIRSMLLKIIEVFTNIAPLKNTLASVVSQKKRVVFFFAKRTFFVFFNLNKKTKKNGKREIFLAFCYTRMFNITDIF